MSDTAADLLDRNVRPLVLDDSTSVTQAALDKITEHGLTVAGTANPRMSGIYCTQWNDPNMSGLGNSQGEWLELPYGDVANWTNSMFDPISAVPIGFVYEPEVLSYKQVLHLPQGTKYATTNFDSILERAIIQLVFDVALSEDSLLTVHQSGGFEVAADLAYWSDVQAEEFDQPEVAVELEVSFPPKNRRTVIGTAGAKLRAPFKTAFSAELAELDDE